MILYVFSLFYISAKLNISRLLIFKGLIFGEVEHFITSLLVTSVSSLKVYPAIGLFPIGLSLSYWFMLWILKKAYGHIICLILLELKLYSRNRSKVIFYMNFNWKSYLLNTVFIPFLIWSSIIWIRQLFPYALTSITLFFSFS